MIELIIQASNMGNCLGSTEKDKRSDDFQTLATKESIITKLKWFKLLKVDKVSYGQSNYSRQKYDHQSFIQIDKDINRTYPNEPVFQVAENKAVFKAALQEISLYFPKQGYIQGINFVVGYFILLDMNQLEAIKSFIGAVTHPKLMLIGNYEDDFPLTRLSCELFWSIFSERSPDFACNIKELNIPDQLWIFQWFLCLYIYSFPTLYVKDILNFIWEEKQFSWVRIALAIMALLQPVITKNKNRFEDEFIESMQLVKTDNYVNKHLPISKLLRKAQQYQPQEIKKHLKKVSIDNWYSRYFLADERGKYDLYKKLEEQLDHNRKEHFNMQRSGIKSSRQNKSMTIIDDIEQIRASKVGGHIINSLSNKVVNSSFLRFKQTYSLGEKGQISMVESYYQK